MRMSICLLETTDRGSNPKTIMSHQELNTETPNKDQTPYLINGVVPIQIPDPNQASDLSHVIQGTVNLNVNANDAMGLDVNQPEKSTASENAKILPYHGKKFSMFKVQIFPSELIRHWLTLAYQQVT